MKTIVRVLIVFALLLTGLALDVSRVEAQASSIVYTVQYGDTLGGIAQRYNTTVTAIATTNNIANPSRIYVGQRIVIPATGGPYYAPSYPTYQGHVVQQGQNLFRIGLIYGYDVTTMAAVNNLANPNRIYSGQVLRVPRRVFHTVRFGDTVGRIARAYGSSVSAIAAVNRLWNVNLIYPGQILQVP